MIVKENLLLQLKQELHHHQRLNTKLKEYLNLVKEKRNLYQFNYNEAQQGCDKFKGEYKELVTIVDNYEESLYNLHKDRELGSRQHEEVVKMKLAMQKQLNKELINIQQKVSTQEKKMKNGMFVICGNSIEELENDLMGMKMALGTGARMACGGSSVADVETALKTMKGAVAPTYSSTDLAQGMINAINKMLDPQEGSCPCCCENGCGCCEENEDEEVEIDLDEILKSEEYDDYIYDALNALEEHIRDIVCDNDLTANEKVNEIMELLHEKLRH